MPSLGPHAVTVWRKIPALENIYKACSGLLLDGLQNDGHFYHTSEHRILVQYFQTKNIRE